MPQGKSPRGRFAIPPNLTPTERVCFCLNWPNDSVHFAILWGLLDELSHRYNWGEPLTADSDTLAQFYSQVIADNRACFEERLAMTNSGCGCDGEPVFRYNQDSIQEVSTDGGETWQASLTDVRMDGTILPPPLWLVVGGDNRCDGAATARINLKTLIDQVMDLAVEIGISALTAAIAAIIGILLPGVGGAIAGLIAAIVIAIVNLGSNVLQASMTTEVYDTLQCIFFCHISMDAQFDEAAWVAVKADIADQLDGNAEFLAWNFVNALGPVGLTNAARISVLIDADCDDCGCGGCDPQSIWQYNYADDSWFHPEVLENGNVRLVGNYVAATDLTAVLIRFGNIATPTCCDVDGYENPVGTLFINVTKDCEGGETSGAVFIPAGCWTEIFFRSNSGAGELEPLGCDMILGSADCT